MDTKQDQITEAQVASYLQARAVELSRNCGDEYVHVRIDVTCYGKPDGQCRIASEAYVNPSMLWEHKSLDVAISNAVAGSSAEVRAEKLRIEAADLIAKARALESAMEVTP